MHTLCTLARLVIHIIEGCCYCHQDSGDINDTVGGLLLPPGFFQGCQIYCFFFNFQVTENIGKWGFLEGEVVRNPEITNPWAIKHHFAVFLSTAFRFAQRLSFCVGFLVARGQRIIWHNLTKPNLTYLAVLAVLDLPKCATNVQMVRDLLVAVLDLTQVHH